MRNLNVVLVVLALSLIGLPAAAQNLSFQQIDYYNNGSLVVPDSEWGQAQVTYTPGSSLQYLNIVENPGTAQAMWVVQNEPLLPSSAIGSSPFTTGELFGMGNTRGTEVTSLNMGYTVSSSPVFLQPTSFSNTGTFSVGDTQNIINSGVPSGDNTLHAPPSTTTVIAGVDPPANFLTRPDMPNVTQEKNFCGPGAATNSLVWLSNTNGYDLHGQTPNDIQTKLAQAMGNNNTGNWDDAEIAGKQAFISSNNLPLEVHYQGGVKEANNGPVTFTWIEDQLNAGQDVEIMTNTHWVVVSGYSDGGPGAQSLEYRDDPYQHGADTTAAEQTTIDNRWTWTNMVGSTINIGNGDETLQTAVAESPTPEPATVTTLGLGLLGSLLLVKRRARMRVI